MGGECGAIQSEVDLWRVIHVGTEMGKWQYNYAGVDEYLN
jgi:hypothetical protein